MALKTNQEDNFVINNPQDFVTNIKHQRATSSWIIIHEANYIDILNNSSILSICHYLHKQKYKNLHFETNIYDALFVPEEKLLVSNKNMPVRLFNVQNNQKSAQWWSIIDKKINTQQYLTPIRMSKCQDTIIGGGKKFTSLYDLNKNTVKLRVQQMNKRYVSSIELINSHTFIAGQFNGELILLDFRGQREHHSFKPHIDLVSNLKLIPNQPNQFLSAARKDNYIYHWDIRMLQTFVTVFENALYGNQRTGLQIHNNGEIIFIGGQKGEISARSLKTGEELHQYVDINKDCVGSICYSDDSLVFAIGERRFPLSQDEQMNNSWIKRVSLAGVF